MTTGRRKLHFGRGRRRSSRRWPWLLVTVVILVGGSAVALVRRPAPPAVYVPNHAFRSDQRPNVPAALWAIGDGADGGAPARRLARRAARDRPARLLYLGDVYERGTAQDFRRNFASVYGSLAKRTAPTPGNHDWPNHDVGYDRYWGSVTGAATPPWYAFRVGGWEVLSLNSEASHDAGSEQIGWLRERLSGAAGTCRLAFWHRPLVSAGRHGDQGDVAPLRDVLPGHAVLVLNGHDHDLQRLRPMRGIVAAVVGAGGHSSYGVDSGDSRVAFANDSADGGLRIGLRPGRADLEFIASDGRSLDRSSVTCTP